MRNEKQYTFYQSPSRYNCVLAGRRGGKTIGMAERRLKRVAASPPGAEIVYIGPTLQHAKDLVWDYFQNRFVELNWQFKPKIAEKYFRLPQNRKLFVIGAEKIDRVRGHKLWDVGFDEIAYFTKPLKDIWKAVRPALSDLKGTADFGTTPDGKHSDAYDFFHENLGKPGWQYHHWITLDNPWIDPLEIEEAKRDLDERSFRQEYMATWETYDALAYYNWDDNIHIKQQSPINYDLNLHLCFDFNVNPTTLLLSQYYGERMHYKREYSFNDSSTERTIHAFCEDYKNDAEKLSLKIRGDATGNNRTSKTGRTDYQYVFDCLNEYGFKYKYEVMGANPPIIDRVKIFNGWLKPLKGAPRVEVDPSCKDLIRDLSGQKLDGRIPSDDGNLGHKADAAGYDIYWQWACESRKPSGVIQL